MNTRLIKYISLLIYFISTANSLFGQETTDNSTYYYNNFETAVAGNITSLGAASKGNANRISTATTIDASTTSPLDGSVSLASIKPATNAIGAVRWNFVGNGTSGVDLTQNDWEWDFVYKNTSTASNDDPDQMVVGNNAWRYWLYSSTYNGNSTQGFYISHVGTNLVLRYRYANYAAVNQYNTILTTALPNNQASYIIKVQRLKNGSWAIYMDPFVAGMTTAQTLATTTTSNTGSGFSTYYYSYLEATATTNARFQWDDFNLYTRVLQFTAVGANSVSTNNITPSPLYPGQTNVIMYGLKIISRGNFNINQLVLSTTGAGFDGYFNNTGTLYFTTNPFFTIGTSLPIASMSLTGNAASNYSLQDYITSSGNTDGSYSNPGYTFITGNVNNTLNYGNPPTGTIAFTGITTLNGNANGNGTNGTAALNYSIIGSPTGNTITFLNTVVPPTASNVSACGPGTYTITASGGNPSGGTYNWYSASSGGTALQSSASTTYAATVSSTTTFYVSYTVGGSTSTRTAVTVNVYPVPVISYATPQTYTIGTAITSLSPTVSGGTPTGYSISSALPAGLSLSTSTGTISGTATAAAVAANYTVTATTASGCSGMATLNITVKPPAPTATGGSTCGPGTVMLTASGGNPTGGTYNWYAASSGGTALQSSTSTTYITPSISSTTTYYVSYTSSGSESNRTAVTATVNPLPVISYATPQTYTVGTAISNLSPTVSGGTSTGYSVSPALPAGLSFSTTTGVISGTATAASAATNYTVIATTASGCTGMATVNITVMPVAPTTSGGSVCGTGSVTLTASGGTPAGGTYNWYASSSGGTALQATTSATYTPNIITTTKYYVSYTTGGAESGRTSVTATSNPVVSSPYSGSAFSYSFSGNTNDVSGNANNGINTGGTALTTDRYGAANSAYNFNGSSQYISSTTQVNNPNVFTLSLWFNTTTAGGKLLGFGNAQTGASGSYDRHIYMSNSGQLYYGIYQNSNIFVISTTASYNDGNWHHVVVTMGTDGSTLYVDGTVQASNASMTTGQNFAGYWRIGYDNFGTGWPNYPTNSYFTGTLDDIAVYNTELSAAQIASSNNLNQIGALATVCAGSPITFNAPTITGATYTWHDSGSGTQTGQNPTFPLAVAGNYTLTVTGGPGGCSSTATITPTINPVPVISYATPQTYTVGTAITNLSPTVSGGTPTGYSVSPALPAGLSFSTTTGVISGTATAAAATANYTVTATTASGCTGMNTVNITVKPPAPTATGGSTCGTGTVTLTASGGNPAGGTYNWYAASSGGTALQSSTATTYTTSSISSTTTYYVSYTSSGSESSRTAVTATVNPLPVISYATPQTYTVGTAITNLSPTVSGGTPTSYSVSPALPAGLSLSTTTGVISGTATVAAPATNYTVTATTASGCTSTATVNITVIPPAPTATGGSTCGTGTVTLTASGGNPAGGTYNWYAASSGGTALQSSASTTYTTPSITTTTTYYVSYTSSGSESSRTAVTATVNPLPVISYATPQTYTVGTAITNLSPTVSGGTPTSYSVSPALPAGLSLSTTTGVISGTATVAAPATNYTVTATTASGCTSTATVNITVIPPAPTATGGSTCGTGTVTLTASGGNPAGGTYNWYAASSGGTALQSSTSTTYTTPSISSTTIYYVSYTSSGSESSRTSVTATVNPLPVISYATPQTYTVGTAITNLSPTVSGGTPASYSVSLALPAGLSLSTTTGVISGTATVAAAATNYTVTATTASGCTGMTTVNITVKPVAPTATGGSTCGPGTVTLTASGGNPTGGTYNWYAASSGGTALQSSTSTAYTTPSISTTTTYYISYTSSGSESNRTSVTATVNPLPVISYATPQTYIVGTAITSLSPTVSGGTPTSYLVSPALPAGLSFSTTTGVISGTATVAAAATNYTVTATTASGCTGMATVNITVKPAVPTATGGSTCGPGTVTLTASGGTPTGGTYNWYAASSGGTAFQSSTATTYTTPSISSTTTYYVSYTSSGSESNRTAVTATVNPLPVISYATPQTYTVGTAISSLSPTVSGGTPTSYSVSPALPAGLSLSTMTGVISGTPTVVTAAVNYTVNAATASGCTGMATVNITVMPVAPTATGGSVCGTGTVTLTASGGTPAGGTYSWYASSSGGTALQATTSATYTANIITTTRYYVSYKTGGIESSRTLVTATANPIISSPYSGALFSYPFSGNTNDISGNSNNGVATGSPTLIADRYNTANSAYNFNGTSQYISTNAATTSPTTFTISLWFNTTTAGGKLIGFGQNQTGANSVYDRNLFMSNTGQLYMGIYNGNPVSINTTNSYNDGNWHHVIVTVGMSGSGTSLYVDGTLQASNTSLVPTANYTGYWRIGYDAVSAYTSAPSNPYFNGTLDDIAVYNRVLTSSEIASSNNLNQIGVGTATVCSPISFSAPSITGATYTWQDSGGNTVTGQNPTFTNAVAGNYTLTVTGGPGGCSSAVTLTPVINALPATTFSAASGTFINTNISVTLNTYVASSTYSWNFGGGIPSTGTGAGPFNVQWGTTGLKTIALTVTNSTGCSSMVTNAVNVNSANYGNYSYMRTITMNNAAVGITTNLANFPVLLSIQNNDLIISGACTDKVQVPNGPNYDFAFVDPSSATELYYQVENYNQTTGTLLVWVRLPSMNYATNNTLGFYYGSKAPPTTHNTAFFQNTWTSDYQAVYHFNEAGYTGTTQDGTAYGRTATLVGFQNTDYITAGKIGSAYQFGGTAGSPTVNDMEAATAPATSAFTVSAWVKMTTGGLDEKIITDQSANGNSSGGYKLGIYTNNIPETEDYGNLNRPAPFYNNPAPAPNAPVLSVGTWYYLQGVYNGSSISTYVNGVQYAVLPSTGNPFLTSTLYIGIGEGKQYPFSGLIDEPRVSNIAKSSDWLKMEYVDQNDPVSFTSISSSVLANTAYAAAISGELTYTWTGTTSTDPTVATNWSCPGTTNQVPAFDGSASLIIPSGLSQYPSLTADAGLYGLTIASGASFNLNGHTLSVGCHIYNVSGGGILYNSSNSSSITWNGSLANQYYYGSATASTGQTGNMTVNNSAAGTITITGGGLDVYNTLTMTKGNLSVAASPAALTLKSSAAQSASVAAIPPGNTISGNVTVERFVTGGGAKDPSTGRWTYRSYRLMSSPVNEGVDGSGHYPYSLNYLNASTIITDVTSTYGTTPGNPSLYLYNEGHTPSNATFTSGTFEGVTDISSTTSAGTISTTDATYPTGKLYAGDGFMLYFRGDNINSLSGVPSKTKAPFVAPENVVFSTTGNLNQGTYSVTSWTGTAGLMYTTSNPGNAPVRGYNLVGNPYASSIDWSLFSNSNTGAAIYGSNVNPSIYLLNPRTSNYDVYSASTGIATGNAGNVIPSGAGFYVQANNTPATLTFTEAAKTSAQVSGNNLLMGRPDNQTAYKSYMRLQLVTDTVNYDDIVVGFNSTSAMKFNPAEDSKYLNGGSALETLASITDDSVYTAVKWLPLPKAAEQRTIPLHVTGKTSGIHTLERTDLKQLPEIYEVWLMDKYKKDSLDIRHNSTYAFNLDLTDTASYGSNRFRVVIRQDPALAIHLLNFTAAKANNGAQLVWKTENEQNYTSFTVERSTDNGKTFQVLGGLNSAGQGTYSFLDKNPQIAVDQYRLEIQDLDGTISYSKVIPLMYSSLSNDIAAGGITIYPNPATSNVNLYIINTAGTTATNSNVSYSITVVNSTGTVITTGVSAKPTWQYNVGSLIPGTYLIQVVNNIDKSLVGKGKFVKL